MERLRWLGQTAKAAIQTSYSNRYVILRGFILLLRIGQVATVGIVCLIYFFFVYEHQFHWCTYNPGSIDCRSAGNVTAIPWSYIVILTAAIASGAQLFLLAFIKTSAPPESGSRDVIRTRASSFHPYSHAVGFLLTATDVPILALWIVAFVALSDRIVPTRILRGARDGTSCYVDNQFDRFLTVELQQCELGQHGYWWSMGILLSYLITSVLYGFVFVEIATAKRAANFGREGGPVALDEEAVDDNGVQPATRNATGDATGDVTGDATEDTTGANPVEPRP